MYMRVQTRILISAMVPGVFTFLLPFMSAVCAGLVLCATDAAADSIVFRGVLYEDVLIYKGAASYYVKIPDEGRVFNVPVEEVHPSQVRMVHDPYYRDELKRRFEDSKKRIQSGEVIQKRDSKNSFSLTVSEDEFSTSDLPASESDLSASEEEDTGLGFTLEATQILLAAGGMTVSMAGDILTATTVEGDITVKLYGNPKYLSKLEVDASVAKAKKNQLKKNFKQMQLMVSGLAPWVGPWIKSNIGLFESGGTKEETQDGRHVLFGVTLDDDRVALKLMLESV